MAQGHEVRQGTLATMVLQTQDVLEPRHECGIACRVEKISHNLLSVNHGTVYPALIKLEQKGSSRSELGVSNDGRRDELIFMTKSRRKDLLSRFLALEGRSK